MNYYIILDIYYLNLGSPDLIILLLLHVLGCKFMSSLSCVVETNKLDGSNNCKFYRVIFFLKTESLALTNSQPHSL